MGFAAVLAGLVGLALLTGCGGDDDAVEPGPPAATPGPTARAENPGPTATPVPPASTAASTTSAGDVVRLIVTPVAGTTPDELADQLAAQFGTDVVLVRTLRDHLVVTVPVDRRAELEQAAGVAQTQDDTPEPAGG